MKATWAILISVLVFYAAGFFCLRSRYQVSILSVAPGPAGTTITNLSATSFPFATAATWKFPLQLAYWAYWPCGKIDELINDRAYRLDTTGPGSQWHDE